MSTKITTITTLALIFTSLAACDAGPDTDDATLDLASEPAPASELVEATPPPEAQTPEPIVALLAGDCELSLQDCALAHEMVEGSMIQAKDLISDASELVWLPNACVGPDNCSALSLFDSVTFDTSHLWSLLDHPNTTDYLQTPPGNQAREWIMGDWNGDGLDSPAYYIPGSGAFRYTDVPASPTNSWSDPVAISDGYDLVAGRFLAGYDNDCVGMINDLGNEVYQLEYWCDLSGGQPAQGSHGTQYIGPVLPDSSFPAGVHQFVAGDWDKDGIDEIAVRRDQYISYSVVNPAAGNAAFAQAQLWGVPAGELPETGEFVSGDWTGDGKDGWGVLYDDNHFFFRSNLAWNPGSDAYSQQHIDNLFANRNVSSHQLNLECLGY